MIETITVSIKFNSKLFSSYSLIDCSISSDKFKNSLQVKNRKGQEESDDNQRMLLKLESEKRKFFKLYKKCTKLIVIKYKYCEDDI